MTDKCIIWVNGNINSGKTTTASLLATKIADSVLIELDDLSAMALHLPLEEKLLYTIEDGLMLAELWIERGFRPILVYPIYGGELDFMLEFLKSKQLDLALFTLDPSIETLLKNRGDRILMEWEKERIKYLHYQCKLTSLEIGHKIYVEDQTPESIVSEILCRL